MDDVGRAAFTAFVVARQTSLLRSATLLTGDRHLAQDLLQDALVKVAARWPRLEHGNPDAYVRTVLYRDFLHWRRKLRREHVTPDPNPAVASDHATLVDERRVILDALRRLPRRQRAVIVLRYFEDLTESETASVLGVSVGTVKSHAHHGLLRLRQLLGTPDRVSEGRSADE